MPPDNDDAPPPPPPPPPAPTLRERVLRELGLRPPRAPISPRLDASAFDLLIRQHELSLGTIDAGQPLDLRGTDATGLTFPECSLHGASLQDAVLHRADLSRVHDLLPETLAGADLTNARLPDAFDTGPVLAFVERLSRNAGKLFAGLLASAAALVLTTLTVDDPSLLGNRGQAILPLVNVAVPVRIFFTAGPVALLLTYAILHLYLNRLWAALATLPAVFPDGAPRERRVHPWLMCDLTRDDFPLLAARRTPLDALQETIFRSLAFALAPLAQIVLWLRLLPRHDWTLTIAQSLVVVLTLWAAGAFHQAAARVRRRVADRRPLSRTALSRSRPFRAAVLFGLLLFVAWGAMGGTPDLSDADRAWIARQRKIARPGMSEADAARAYRMDGRRWPLIGDAVVFWEGLTGVQPMVTTWWQSAVPTILQALRIDTAARFTEKDVSPRPDGWVDPGEEGYASPASGTENNAQRAARDAVAQANERIRMRLKLVTGADLRGANLAGARADRALLVNADLRDAWAPGASLHQADLRRANAAGANLSFANLTFARLQGALLTQARLQGAHLGDARLQEADLAGARLDDADLGGARLQGAALSRASLRGAQMVGAVLDDAYLGKANLEGAYLFNASLRGAQMPGARLGGADLSDAHLERADLARADLTRADLSRVRCDRANLGGALLRQATLLGTDLRGARLDGADLDGALAFRGEPDDPRNTHWQGGRPPAGYELRRVESKDGGVLYALRRR